MKVVLFWVLVVGFGLLATQVAFAKENNVYKTVAIQKSGKTGGNIPSASSSGLRSSSVAIKKTGKTRGTRPTAQKNSSSINGTEIHLRH